MFAIQDLDFSGSQSSDEVFLNASNNAIKGSGAFGFVTRDGLKITIEDPQFISFLKLYPFLLIVGVDEITNRKALERLSELQVSYPNLTVRVYFKPSSYTIFHPKAYWFQKSNGGVLNASSSNMTFKGLRKNTEIGLPIDVDKETIQRVENEWNTWLDKSEDYLWDLNAEKIIEQAKINEEKFKRKGKGKGKPVTTPEQNTVPEEVIIEDETDETFIDNNDLEVWSFNDTSLALVAEIPESGDRWKQANFSKEVFNNFFGVVLGAGVPYTILLRNVSRSGNLESIESRPQVSVKSQNYRFELSAASGIPYPEDGAPIGIFIRVAVRTFIYCLVFPEEASYQMIYEFLNNNYKGAARTKKRVMTTCNQIEDIINNLPLATLKI